MDDLTLDVSDGELVVLVGPSGCGKTTTLRLIAGLERLSGGAIRIGDRVVNDVAPRNRDVAMVFQHYALYPHMNVYKNMAFGLRVRGSSKTEIERHVGRVAERLGLSALLGRKPSQLSGGERQRVALGRAIIRRPQLFLLDEPLSNLDESLRAGMRAEIKTLQRELGTTMVYVTHDQEEAMTLSDRIAVLRHGRLQQLGRPMEIYDRPGNRFIAGFFGSPAMNLIAGELRVESGKVVFQCRGLRNEGIHCGHSRRTAAAHSVVLGIRPHDIVVRSAGETGSDTPGARHAGMVRLVDPLGDSQVLRVVVGEGIELTAKVVADQSWTAGSRVEITFPPERMHLFETNADGRRLSFV